MTDDLAEESIRQAARAYLSKIADYPMPSHLVGSSRKATQRRRAFHVPQTVVALATFVGVAVVVGLPILLASHHFPGQSAVPPPVTASPTGTALPSPSATPSPTSTPSPSPISSAAMCQASQLQLAYLPDESGAAAGNVGVELAIRNAGSQPCELRGYPQLQLLGSGGAALATNETQTTTIFSGDADVASIILSAGTPPLSGSTEPGYAYISFAGDDVMPSCETAASVAVLVPGDATRLVVDLRVEGLPSGLQFCSGGKIQVLPIHS